MSIHSKNRVQSQESILADNEKTYLVELCPELAENILSMEDSDVTAKISEIHHVLQAKFPAGSKVIFTVDGAPRVGVIHNYEQSAQTKAGQRMRFRLSGSRGAIGVVRLLSATLISEGADSDVKNIDEFRARVKARVYEYLGRYSVDIMKVLQRTTTAAVNVLQKSAKSMSEITDADIDEAIEAQKGQKY